MNVLKIATLNINGIHTPTWVTMLHDFLKSHDLDILFLQEVTHRDLDDLMGYATHTECKNDDEREHLREEKSNASHEHN